jgi:ABC-type transporter lipoprotein component MlaA
MLAVEELKNAILLDIEDVKAANHEKLLMRNDRKQALITHIENKKLELNNTLTSLVRQGVDINQYRTMVDNLEENLKELYKLNQKLGLIVLPVHEMYKEMIQEMVSHSQSGDLVSVRA